MTNYERDIYHWQLWKWLDRLILAALIVLMATGAWELMKWIVTGRM